MIVPLVAYGMLTKTAGSTPAVVEEISSNEFFDNLILEENIHDKIRRYANEYGVSYEQVDRLIGCETQHTYDPSIRSTVRYKFSDSRRGIVRGEQEMSYGLVQIHLPDHPYVSLEQATDPDFALSFLMKNWDKREQWWSCWGLVN